MKLHRIIFANCVWAAVFVIGCRSAVHAPSPPEFERAEKKQDLCEIAVIRYCREKDPGEDVAQIFVQLAEKGDPRGTMWLARLYKKGRCSMPMRPDYAQKMATDVIADIKRLAEKGDREAQFLLGAAHQEALGTDRNLEKARQWYNRAAEAGHVLAMNNLGFMLAMGHGGDPNIVKARFLFSRAAEQGSFTALHNIVEFGPSDQGDQQRLQALRSVAAVQALGMRKDEGIRFLAERGLIANPNDYQQDEYKERQRYRFRQDGLVLNVDVSDRITNVEGHAHGSIGKQQFRGENPLGLSWKANGRSTVETFGTPDDHGYHEPDEAYGYVYRMDNVCFVVLTGYEGDRTVKLWRVFEKWAVKYPPAVSAQLNK
jgi:Sel1 repeat